MSVLAIGAAIALRGVTPSEKLLLLVLANYANPETGECYPSQRRLADDTGLTDRTIRTVFKALEDKGLVDRSERRRDDGSRRSDVIVLRLEQPEMISGGAEIDRKANRKPFPGGAETVSGKAEIISALETSPNRQEEPPIASAIGRARGSRRCPADWMPDQKTFNVGVSAGLSAADITAELTKFRDHEFAKPKTEWAATFRNWLRTAAEGKQRNERNRNSGSGAVASDPRRANTDARRNAWVDLAQERDGAGFGGLDQHGTGGRIAGRLPSRPAQFDAGEPA